LSLVTLMAFLVITEHIREDHSELDQFDHRVAEAMEQHAADHPAFLPVMGALTFAGGIPVMSVLAVAGTAILFWRRRWLLGIVWVLAAGGGALLDLTLKDNIDRRRPGNPDAMVSETNPSFPSGHAMGSVVGYGMLGYVLLMRQRRRWVRLAVATGLIALVLSIGVSRIYLRAHYLSDVIGGFCIGTVWLAACISAHELVRRRAGLTPAYAVVHVNAGPPVLLPQAAEEHLERDRS
jgi:undecaprenyl-diphosphatase